MIADEIPKMIKGVLLVFFATFLFIITAIFWWGAGFHYSFDPVDSCGAAQVPFDINFPRSEVDSRLFPISMHCNARDDIVSKKVNIIYSILIGLTAFSSLWTIVYGVRASRDSESGRWRSK